MNSALIGTWWIDPEDSEALRNMGKVSMTFGNDGQLTYTVHKPDREERILLTFRVDGDWLVTDQSSSPKEERTRFEFTPDGLLVLNYEGQSIRYVRAPHP
jgi:uncharacterized protein YndB with AHSA1/START domain